MTRDDLTDSLMETQDRNGKGVAPVQRLEERETGCSGN